MGILALLDEESLFPKASDGSYVEKLHKNHDGKSVSYGKPSFKSRGSVVHFELHHYAGTVRSWSDVSVTGNDPFLHVFK